MKLSVIKNILEENNLLIECKTEGENISNLSYDSREVCENTLFFCKGNKFKEEYLKNASDLGATCFVSENNFGFSKDYFLVKDIRSAMALIASEFYNHAYKDLETIAITGTKGKTTVSYFIKNILDEYINKKSAIITTVEVFTGKRSEEAHLTTPEALLLHKLFNEVKESNLKYLTMEVTSQAYKTKRVEGVKFSHGMFLNISEDHISAEEHSDFADYLNCKLELIRNCSDMVINKDMECFELVKNECVKNSVSYVTYGKDDLADYFYYGEFKNKNGFSFTVENKSKNFKEGFAIAMPGRFNIENAVAAIAMMVELGIDIECIKRGLLKTEVMGRMNVFEKDGVTVIVDYAHNKLSFTKLYESVKLDYPDKFIISVGGAPGGKAYKRRKDFAEIVCSNSDYVILTAEDPQFEKVEDICNEIIKFMPKNCKYKIIPDRLTAVEEALNNRKEGDLILLLAKSEEEYQKVNGNFMKYESDLKITKRILEK